MGIRPEVSRPTPPFALAVKYSIILLLGRPSSSHIMRLPIGAITTRFLMVSRPTRIGEKIEV